MRRFWKLAVRLYPFTRGRHRLMEKARRAVGGVVLDRDRFGNLLLLDLDNLIDCYIYLEGAYEWKTVHTLAEQGRRHGCTHFIDIGANIGIYSLFFARDPGMKKLWAFEPDPRNHAQLNANLWLNRVYDRVELSRAALSSQEGTVTFYVNKPQREPGKPNFNTGTSSLLAADSPHHMPISVQTRRLDEVVTLRGENILMKIDVEGAEAMVLEGATGVLRENRCLIMTEVWKDSPEKLAQVTQFMGELGYQRMAVDLDGENFLFGKA